MRQSGLNWAVGRNGIYIEPDIAYIESYKRLGGIRNCAGDGRCAYTTRAELAFAYACLLKDNSHDGKTYNLSGIPISQKELVGFMNHALGTQMTYEFVDAQSFKKDRIAEIGEFYGTVVAGIYEAIATGAFDNESQFKAATGREHVSWSEFLRKNLSRQNGVRQTCRPHFFHAGALPGHRISTHGSWLRRSIRPKPLTQWR